MSFPLAAEQTIPAGMVEVTKDEFYATVGQMNVSPSVQNPAFTSWETPDQRRVGWSWPGWKDSGVSFLTGQRYAVIPSLAKTGGAP